MKSHLILGLALVILFTSCSKDDPSNQIIVKEKLSGLVQKGPFISGTNISVYELNTDLSQTGKTFSTQITDNNGSFELNNIVLASSYVSLRADGFYFNEVTGKSSNAQISLSAICDIINMDEVNINLLTHLEKPRVEFLMQSGTSFAQAKVQAQKEVLAIFGFEKNDMLSSENLSIAGAGDGNGILLAVSAIILGNHTDSELTELLSKICEDIKQDGILNNEESGSALINQAKLLDINSVGVHLSKRYAETGMIAELPEFEKYIGLFIDSSQYTFTDNIEYPEEGSSGLNILAGTSLKVQFIPDYIEGIPDPKETNTGYYSDYAIWNYLSSGWLSSDSLYMQNHTSIYYNSESDRIIDAKFYLLGHGAASIEIYENNKVTPTRVKRISW